MDTVADWKDVRERARQQGFKVHIGRIFGICVEKGSELGDNDPDKYFKGRYVFQGNQVSDEWGDIALFNELSSNPASIEASKMVDAYGLFLGNDIQQADAEQAYIQSELGEYTPACGNATGGGRPKLIITETWVKFPPEHKPAEWSHINDPVVRLRKALYGHPDSGGYWERHCDKIFKTQGFETIPNWPSLYWNASDRLMSVSYTHLTLPTIHLV